MRPELLEYLRYNLTTHLASLGSHDSALLGGSFGEVFALFLLNRQLGQRQDNAYRYLDETFETLHHSRPHPTYCNGLAGMGIGLMLLGDCGIVDLDKEALRSFDTYLSEQMQSFIVQGNYDLLHGATGIALYFVKRSTTATDTARDALELYIKSLDRSLLRNADGCTWCRMKTDFSAEERNISMSHGLAGITNVLAQIYARRILPDDDNDKARAIIGELTHTILRQRIDFMKYRSSFPSYHKSADIDSGFSRLAWCYGDIGILATLSVVADALADTSLAARIKPLILAETTRRGFEHTYVRDACVCHGASGIYAYLAHAAGQYPDDHAISEAAAYWRDYILRLPKEKLCYDPIAKEYNRQYSILGGYAGIALALIDDSTVINKLLLYEKI